MSDAVADAGPLIHLDELGLWEALRCFRRVHVPAPVAKELAIGGPDLPGATLRPPAHVVDVDHVPPATTPRLSVADRSVLTTAASLRVPVVLTDDLDLREAVRAKGLQPVGTLGIMILAVRRGHVGAEAAGDALAGLRRRSTLYASDRVLAAARRALERT